MKNTNLKNVNKGTYDKRIVSLLKNKNSKNVSIKKVMRLGDGIYNFDEDLYYHAARTGLTCYFLGSAMGLAKDASAGLLKAGFLHDIGKTLIPVNYFYDIAGWSHQRYEKIKKHSLLGYRMLVKRNGLLKRVELDAILMHHKRYDLKGYPEGVLKGDMFFAHCIAICDAYDAMTHERPYGSVLDLKQATAELRSNSGSQFHPGLVDVFIENIPNIIKEASA